MKALKIIFIALFIITVVIAAAGAYLYINRQSIIDANLNGLIKNILPKYLEVEDLKLDLKSGAITIKNLKLINAKGYTHPYFAVIKNIRCPYTEKVKGDVLKGIKVSDIHIDGISVYAEHTKDGRLNIRHLGEVFKSPRSIKRKAPGLKAKLLASAAYMLSPVKNIEDFIDLRPVLDIESGSIIFEDSSISNGIYKTTIEDISAEVVLDISKDLKELHLIKTHGKGFLNGRDDQAISWDSIYNPSTPKLTMSNTFNIRGVDIVHFRPYYDKFSPFLFKKGRADGRLIFNFDNGSIGSTNEVILYALALEVKEGQSRKDLWEASAEDLYKYFTSESGGIVFDFKIKGPMEAPRFYLGPKVKRSLAKMVFGKITDAFFKNGGPDTGRQQPQHAPEAQKSDIEQLIDIFTKRGQRPF